MRVLVLFAMHFVNNMSRRFGDECRAIGDRDMRRGAHAMGACTLEAAALGGVSTWISSVDCSSHVVSSGSSRRRARIGGHVGYMDEGEHPSR